MNIANSLVGGLHAYTLPDAILPLAPRQPFARFSPAALETMIERVLAHPEKRGMMSHAIRALADSPAAPPSSRWVTIEAHFDAAPVPAGLADRLVSLGFELDGFHMFVPGHFSEHFTLKYKLNRGDVRLRRMFKADVDRATAALKEDLARSWPGVEAYIETEVYTERDRRQWDLGGLDSDWRRHWPFKTESFKPVRLPRTNEEAVLKGLPLDLVKRCDIHAKLDRNLDEAQCSDLIDSLTRLGFYNVRTWAGNNVCTGQFAEASEGRTTFDQLCEFFGVAGGCSEITLEYVPSVWRSSYSSDKGTFLAELPPLIVEGLTARRAEGEHERGSGIDSR